MSTETIQREAIPAGRWAYDPGHSFARFEVGHGGISTFRGGFGQIEATLEGGEAAKLVGAVEVASIDVAEEQIKGHLLSPEFFDAERYPQVRFTSTAIEATDDGEVSLRGDLQIRDNIHEVTATGRYGVADFGVEKLGLSLEASINRSEFGMDWQMELPSGGNALEYEVKLIVELEFVKDGE